MALKKIKNLHNEIVAEYWKITKISVNRLSKTMQAEISLFKNQTMSNSGQPPFLSHSASDIFTSEELGGDLTALAYNMFKDIASSPTREGIVIDRQITIKNDLKDADDV